jgi:predicted nucleic acid-binding protein
MIVDASVLLCAFFPDEAQPQAQKLVREHVAGRVQLKAPALLVYELSNAVWQAEQRKRITAAQADEILQAFAGLEIEIIPPTFPRRESSEGEMLSLTRRFNCSAYEAAYLALALAEKAKSFITADERLYHAVQAHLDWVIWIRDYACEEEME